ncbi:MAG TPA: aspartyl protease family protein [Chitinophagales bacterium]|nr:aspartyl protease family protein [Chitinophagales bacterium]
MKKFISFLLLLLFVYFSPAQTKNYYIESGKSKTTFPFKVFNNILLVDVKINNSKTLKFIFDSGCKSTIVIHPAWIDSFDIPYKQKVFFFGLGYKDSIETMKMENGKLEIGGLRGEHIPVFILSKDSLNLDNYLGTKVDGIFGAEIFEKYYVHINYKKRWVEISEKKPVKKLKSGFTKIPVEIRKSKGYVSCVLMNESGEMYSSELLFDTGANIPVIIKNKEPSDLNIEKYVNAEIGEGLSGSMFSKISRIKRIFIDTFKLNNVVAAFNETPITFKELDENTLDGNIGNDILSRFDMHFAYPEKAVYLKPTRSMNEVFDFNISNIILLENKTTKGGFIVKSIAGDSPPLLAGLQKGDEIIKIDKYKCADIYLEDALLLLNKRIGRKITIQFMRNNVSNKITYKLVSII